MAIVSARRPAEALPEPVRRLVHRLGEEPKVHRVILFGSRARGDFQPRADVDLAVDAPGLSALEWLRLSDIAEDVDTLLKIDLVRLDEAPPELRARIEAEGRTLHER